MKTCAAIAVFFLALLSGGCRGGAKADRSAAGAGDVAGIVNCEGYVVIATQTAHRTVELQDVANVALAPVRGTDGLAEEEDRSGRRLSRVLSDFGQAPAVQALQPPSPASFPGRDGDTADGFGMGLTTEPANDRSISSWGWLNADVQRAEQPAALRETTPSSWLSIGTDDKDTLGDFRLNSDDLSGLNDDK